MNPLCIRGVFGKDFAQVLLFELDGGQVDANKRGYENSRQPEAARSDDDAAGDQQRTRIERIASVGVRTGGCKLSIFCEMAGGPGAQQQSQDRDGNAGEHGASGRIRKPSEGNEQQKPAKHAQALNEIGVGFGKEIAWSHEDRTAAFRSERKSASATCCGVTARMLK